MNKYLIEILKIQNSVILPGLGALMVPSQKTGKIVFNQHLKFNDGSLARFIAEKEGIDSQEAQNKVAKFIREIEAELGKGNSYDMFEFGRFVKNKDGDVNFEMTADSISGGSEEEEAAPVTEKKKPVVTPADILHEDKKAEEKESKKKAEKAEKAEKKAAEKAKADAEAKKAEELKAQAEKDKKEAAEKAKNTLKEAEDKAKEASESVEEKLSAKDKEKIVPPVIASSKTEIKAAADKQSKNKFTPAEEAQHAADAAKASATSGAAKVTASISEIGDSVKDAKKAFDKKDTSKSSFKDTSTKVVIEKEEKKKKSKLPWIILLLLLIGLAVAGYFFKSEIMTFLNMGDEHSEVDESNEDGDSHGEDEGTIDGSDEIDTPDEGLNAGTDTLEVVEEPVEEVVTKPVDKPTKTVVTSSSSGNYHLIGNSFSEKSNAEGYVSAMQAKGYPAKILGRFDGLYMVTVKSYDSRSAANSGISSVSSDASDAWVFKWPK